jgi:hypothetical protein
VQIDLLVFHALPKPLDEQVVPLGPFAIHVDFDLMFRQNADESRARKL